MLADLQVTMARISATKAYAPEVFACLGLKAKLRPLSSRL